MNLKTSRLSSKLATLSFVLCAAISVSGCFNDHYLLASTATSLGVELSQNPATQSPQAKFGYQRAEIAYVPTNRFECEIPDPNANEPKGKLNCSGGNGAKDVADVLMELKYTGIFSGGEGSGLYQRLAVGPDAVKQPGAAFMFLRDTAGKIDVNAATAAKEVVQGIEAGRKQAAIAEFQIISIQKKTTASDGETLITEYGNVLKKAYPTAEDQKTNEYIKLANVAKFSEVRALLEDRYPQATAKLFNSL